MKTQEQIQKRIDQYRKTAASIDHERVDYYVKSARTLTEKKYGWRAFDEELGTPARLIP